MPPAPRSHQQKQDSLAKIFICYRRDDSGPAAGRIYDRLEDHFGRGQVFMDVDDVPLGVDYRDYLDRQIGDCDLVLAVMGPKWLTARDGRRGRRLDAPRDFVRTEIEIALKRDIPLIPVLLEGVTMPREDQLPTPIQPLAYRNAATVHAAGAHFRAHMGHLIRGIDRLLGQPKPEPESSEEPAERPQAADAAPRRQPHSRPPGRMPGPSAKDGKPAAAETSPGEPRSPDAAKRNPGPAKAAPPANPEVRSLLAEIADPKTDPKTDPKRRLAIGDLLAELGDPRPGVGTVEIEVPVDREEPAVTETAPAEGSGETIRRRPGFGPEVDALLAEIDEQSTEPPRRLEIGDALDRTGDPRPGVGLRSDGVPDIDWVEIPGGPFVYQDGQSRELPRFWTARYPVTNAQFQAFIDDGGYGRLPGKRGRNDLSLDRTASGNDLHLGSDQQLNRDWWHGLERPKPDKPGWTQGNRPRTNVDWYEAVAFTRWLSARLGLREGGIRLPTELEWEKAARGAEGRIYPWGNEYQSGVANVDERSVSRGEWYLKQTTAVGLYPHGRSPDGVEDLAGNVWEWCLNKYDDPEAVAPDTSGASRALRGGSWDLNPGFARAGYRSGVHPVRRYDGRGFRLLSSVPIEPVR